MSRFFCPFWNNVTNKCLIKDEARSALPYGGFGGCGTQNYPKCEAYKWKHKTEYLKIEIVVFT